MNDSIAINHPPRVRATSESAETISCAADERDDLQLWRSLLDELLKWKSNGDEIFEANDVPSPEVLESAIDWVVDAIDEDGQPAPSSVVPLDGQVVFEWANGSETIMLEVVGPGRFEYTLMRNGRVTESYLLRRDPATRKLQLSGN